jgi:maltose alpha-D-glucosyltransferase/alpha-amylase
MKNSPLIPADRSELAIMLRSFLIQKVVSELGYELNNRPEWADLPLRGIDMILRESRCS